MEPLRQRMYDDIKYEDNEILNRGNKKQINKIPYSLTLKAHKQRLIACNGDCGSKIAKIINDCIHLKVM